MSTRGGKLGKNKSGKTERNAADERVAQLAKAKDRLRGPIEGRVARERRAFEEQVALVESAVVTREALREASRFLTPEAYDDVVTERALDLRCGYPACPNRLPDSLPKDLQIPRLRISFAKGIYDESHLIPYCSKQCYAGTLRAIPFSFLFFSFFFFFFFFFFLNDRLDLGWLFSLLPPLLIYLSVISPSLPLPPLRLYCSLQVFQG